ncbi:hypothetical protein ARALYDRAFT_917498 [Arabidopsis lyrata subsp. lyrata]|uniref:Uncharacterized protein n=1 Tax=Arabidopsis lyrata subsp. lyrata TaxID=81972 RepID=D7MS36_ARALL|nr:hypothetical protein ARALYDRAFT_917498 [Arabidopsis lyrata subsp. lyrata]
MAEHVLPILKYSFDDLKHESAKLCLSIRIVGYARNIDINQGINRATNRGFEIVGVLSRAKLLMEDGGSKQYVEMHDVIRKIAMWITSNFGNDKERWVVQANTR